MNYNDVIAPVSRDEALTVRCPKCLAYPSVPCMYTLDQMTPRRDSGWYEPRVITHRKGDLMVKVHNERNTVIRARRERAWRREQRDTRPVRPMPAETRAANAAMRAWDLREYGMLRAWLAEYGYLLTEAGRPRRPDGTSRGETYLWGG